MEIRLQDLTKDLTNDNVKAYLSLELSEEQMNHAQLGTMMEILEEAIEKEANLRAIYRDEQMIGFVDYGHFPEEKSYHIYHFLIAEKFQGHGYGKAALLLLIEELSGKPDCEQITIPYMSFNETATNLYAKVGFVAETVEDDEPGDRFAILKISKYKD